MPLPHRQPFPTIRAGVSGKACGITLVELMIALLIISLLVSFTVGSLPGMAQQKRLQADVDQFVATLALARHTAIVLGITVTVCPAGGTVCGKRNTWHHGTLVFQDMNANRRLDGREQVISRLPPMRHSRVVWRAFRNRSYLQFAATGMTDWQNGHFLFCPVNNNAQHARQLVLNYAGRVYSSADTDNDGVDEDVQGQPLNCPP